MTLSITNDYLYFDNQEAITYIVIENNGVSLAGSAHVVKTETAIAKVLKRSVTVEQVDASAGRLQVTDTRFNVPVALIGSTVPKEGHQIRDASGALYRVLYAELQSLGTRWRIYARRIG